jgi:amino acid permease
LASSSGAQATRNDTIGETRFAAITTAIIVLSYIVAMTVSSLDKVLAYVGSTGSTSISFILPGLFFYKISAPDSIHHQRLTKEDDDEYEESFDQGFFVRGTLTSAWRTILLRRLALALAIYGLLVMIVCLITNTFFIVAH